ncbi:hypothetical protein QBC39DRAFT_399537 [Podospora conica]|nr:hypothetical protein QBC39DRAFT_399537 [Schizothecium conicum]
MSLQALCGSPWFITSAVVVTTSIAMLRYRRVVISYGRVQSLHAAFFILVCLGLMLVFNFPFRLRHSIYDITEGKTSGPWRPEWGSHKSSANATTSGTAHADEVTAYITSLAKKHNLPPSIPFLARRLQPKTSYSNSLPPSLTTLKSPFLPAPHTFRNTTTPAPHPPPLPLPLNRSKSPPTDASPLLFAISTTYSRLTTLSLPQTWSRFLTTPNPAHRPGLLLLLHDASPPEVAAAQATLTALGISASVSASAPDSHTGGRYAQLMQRLMHARVQQMISPPTPKSPKRLWFALLNDDVFLPRPGALLRELRGFDAAAGEYILAAPGSAADWHASTPAGELTTAGGGAVFLTARMLDVLGQLLCLQDAKKGENDGLGPDGWAGRLVECLGRGSGGVPVEMHVLPGLTPGAHEAYAEGDGGLAPLAMHPAPEGVAAGHAVTAACGEACWGQRWAWRDGWVVVGGREVVQFVDGEVEVLPVEEEVAKEVKVAEGLVVMKEGPKGEKGGEKRIKWQGRRRRTWRVLDAEVRKETGEVWQAFVRRKGRGDLVRDGDDGEEEADGDSLVLLIWEGEK